MIRRALAAGLAATVLSLSAAPTQGGAADLSIPPVRLTAAYDGVLVVKVLDMSIDQQIGPAGFAAKARLKSHGVLSMFKKIDVTAGAEGRLAGGEPRPAVFHHVNLDGQVNRKVRVDWTGQDVTTSTSIAYPSPGYPAPTRGQKLAAADPLTELARITLAPAGGAPCGVSNQLFDGRQLYRLDFAPAQAREPTARERALGLKNPIRCAMTFTELAGFDPKPAGRKNQGLGQPLSIDFARAGAGGPWVIAAIRGRTPLGEARIEIRDLKTD